MLSETVSERFASHSLSVSLYAGAWKVIQEVNHPSVFCPHRPRKHSRAFPKSSRTFASNGLWRAGDDRRVVQEIDRDHRDTNDQEQNSVLALHGSEHSASQRLGPGAAVRRKRVSKAERLSVRESSGAAVVVSSTEREAILGLLYRPGAGALARSHGRTLGRRSESVLTKGYGRAPRYQHPECGWQAWQTTSSRWPSLAATTVLACARKPAADLTSGEKSSPRGISERAGQRVNLSTSAAVARRAVHL